VSNDPWADTSKLTEEELNRLVDDLTSELPPDDPIIEPLRAELQRRRRRKQRKDGQTE
jgi:hypothetical protein